MSSNSAEEVPDVSPPAVPDTPPPSIPYIPPPSTLTTSSPFVLLRSPSPLSPPEKPPRLFSDSFTPNGSKTSSRDPSPTPSGSFQTPPDSLQMPPDFGKEEQEKPSSSSTLTSSTDASSGTSSDLSPPAETSEKPASSDSSQLPPSDAKEKPASDSSQAPSDAKEKPASDSSQAPSDAKEKPASDSSQAPSNAAKTTTMKKKAPAPTVSVVPADADDVFVDSEVQSSTVLLRKPSQRSKGVGAPGDSKIKRVFSARFDRIGSAISRLMDRDKGASNSDRERPRSMSALDASVIRRSDYKENDYRENRDSLVPYGSNFLRRSFHQKSSEFESEDAERPPSPVSTVGRQSVYNEDLVASLVCAACGHYMVAPIEQCKRGHNICKFCRRRAHQHRCPACNARLSGIRNLVAEDMARKLLFPCVHAHAGCTRQVPNDELEFHEPRCPFRVYNCLINVASGVPCKWEGRREHLEEHVRSQHSRYYSEQETTKWRWSPNLLVKMEDFQLISAFGELFWYCAAQDPDRLRVCWFVQHIGYDQDSVKFEFRFSFAGEEKDRRLELSCTTLPDYSSVGSIVESGRCLDMSYQQALSFVDEEGTIKFSVTICKLD